MATNILEVAVANKLLALMERFQISPAVLNADITDEHAVLDIEKDKQQSMMEAANLAGNQDKFTEAERDMRQILEQRKAIPQYAVSFVVPDEFGQWSDLPKNFKDFVHHLERNMAEGVMLSGQNFDGNELVIRADKLGNLYQQLENALDKAPRQSTILRG